MHDDCGSQPDRDDVTAPPVCRSKPSLRVIDNPHGKHVVRIEDDERPLTADIENRDVRVAMVESGATQDDGAPTPKVEKVGGAIIDTRVIITWLIAVGASADFIARCVHDPFIFVSE